MSKNSRIIDFNTARRKQQDEPSLAKRLAWIEELEDALETMTKAEVSTREELEALLADLESGLPPDQN